MSEKVTCDIFLAINEDGDYFVDDDEEPAVQALVDVDGGVCIRVIKITAKITPPSIEEIELDIPDEAGETKQIEAEAV